MIEKRTIMLGALLAAMPAAGLATLTAPAAGQSLAERLAEVRQRQEARQQDVRIRILQALFYEKLTVRFEQTPAREAFDYLRTALGVPLLARMSTDPVGHGIDPDTPITLAAEDMMALDLLEQVLEQCSVVEDCTWQLRRSFLEVGTKERLAVPAAQDLRAYPIDDLLYEAPDFEDAPGVGIAVGRPYPDGYADPYYPHGGNYGYGRFTRSIGSRSAGGGFGGSFAVRSGPGNSAADREERARSILDTILDTIEPTAWQQNGGAWASITYREGVLIVRAPDFIQRQIGGYPRVPPPRRTAPDAAP